MGNNSSSFWSLRSVWKKWAEVEVRAWKESCQAPGTIEKASTGRKKTGFILPHSWCRWKCNSSRPICWMIRALLWQFGKVLWQSDLSIKDMSLILVNHIHYLFTKSDHGIQHHTAVRQDPGPSAIANLVYGPNYAALSSKTYRGSVSSTWAVINPLATFHCTCLVNRDRYIGFLIIPI